MARRTTETQKFDKAADESIDSLAPLDAAQHTYIEAVNVAAETTAIGKSLPEKKGNKDKDKKKTLESKLPPLPARKDKHSIQKKAVTERSGLLANEGILLADEALQPKTISWRNTWELYSPLLLTLTGFFLLGYAVEGFYATFNVHQGDASNEGLNEDFISSEAFLEVMWYVVLGLAGGSFLGDLLTVNPINSAFETAKRIKAFFTRDPLPNLEEGNRKALLQPVDLPELSTLKKKEPPKVEDKSDVPEWKRKVVFWTNIPAKFSHYTSCLFLSAAGSVVIARKFITDKDGNIPEGYNILDNPGDMFKVFGTTAAISLVVMGYYYIFSDKKEDAGHERIVMAVLNINQLSRKSFTASNIVRSIAYIDLSLAMSLMRSASATYIITEFLNAIGLDESVMSPELYNFLVKLAFGTTLQSALWHRLGGIHDYYFNKDFEKITEEYYEKGAASYSGLKVLGRSLVDFLGYAGYGVIASYLPIVQNNPVAGYSIIVGGVTAFSTNNLFAHRGVTIDRKAREIELKETTVEVANDAALSDRAEFWAELVGYYGIGGIQQIMRNYSYASVDEMVTDVFGEGVLNKWGKLAFAGTAGLKTALIEGPMYMGGIDGTVKELAGIFKAEVLGYAPTHGLTGFFRHSDDYKGILGKERVPKKAQDLPPGSQSEMFAPGKGPIVEDVTEKYNQRQYKSMPSFLK